MPPGDEEAKLRLKNDVPTQLCEDSVGFPPPPPSSASSGHRGKKGRRKNLAVACSFKVVVGVRKVCQVSQLYPAIDDLATRELGSMMPSLFTLQAPLVFLFFPSHGHVLQSSFSLLSRGGAISCSIISGRQMEKKINTGKVVFIQCRLTSNTCFFFPSAKIFKGCS